MGSSLPHIGLRINVTLIRQPLNPSGAGLMLGHPLMGYHQTKLKTFNWRNSAMNTMKYISLACSKDKTHRRHLCEVYRDKTSLVATDGHRLHISNGLPEVEPHYLSGLDAEFPDYRMAFPKDEHPNQCTIQLTTKNMQEWNKLNMFRKVQDKTVPALLNLKKGEATLTMSAGYYDVKYTLPWNVTIDKGTMPEVLINSAYLYDAMQMLTQGHTATISMGEELSPVIVKGRLNDANTTALIMPMRKQ